MQITFDGKKKLDTNPIFGLLVQGENRAESIQIKGPKVLGALDLSQLRMAVRVTSPQYKTTVEKTLEQTADEDTITLTWNVDKQFTASPGPVQVMLIGYGGNDEVIKITSSGITVKEDQTFSAAPPESAWEQILQQMRAFATQAYESKTAAKNSETAAKASETAAKASETNAASSASASKSSETAAKASETAAKASETNAASSASAAKTSETAAAGSASTASEKADDAGESASAAAASAAAAKTSETNAANSKTAAKASETNAASSASASKSSETAAKASETAAKASETNAASSASAAKTSETAAAGSASTASEKADDAGESASAAAASAAAAKTSETNAANSKTAAKASETNAKASETAAADSQKVAEEKAEQATNAASEAAAKTEQQIRQYADDRYARPLVTKTGPAASLEVYPDTLSNLKVYANGFTKQAGAGDPSPTNVRALTNGGLRMRKMVLEGSESWEKNGSSVAYMHRILDALGESTLENLTGRIWCDILPTVDANSQYGFGTVGIALDPSGYIQIVVPTKTDPSAWLEANNATIWYVPADESKATGLYAPIQIQGGEYRATCLPLTAPLCEGDSVVSWARSGCDKVVTLDGSLSWTASVSNPGLFYVAFPASDILLPSAESVAAQILTDRYRVVPKTQILSSGPACCIQVSGSLIQIYDPSIESIESFKEIFDTSPLLVWYRSTNYNEAADIPVSLEIHQRAVRVLDGSESWSRRGSAPYPYFVAANVLRQSVTISNRNAKCSHFNPSSISASNSDQGISGYGLSLYLRWSDFDTVESLTPYLSDQYDAGTPVTIVYLLITPITYAHPAVELPALPDDTGKVTIAGQSGGTVTAVFNKSIIKEIAEIKAAMLAMGANLSM